MYIHCTGCDEQVLARLTYGFEMYPHRPDLESVPFWKCDTCGAFVGTHYRSKKPEQRYQPLGFLATKEIKRWRMLIHQLLDPLWKSGKIDRSEAYRLISKSLGHTFHAGEIYDEEEGRFVYQIVKGIKNDLDPSHGPWNRS